MNPYVAQPVHVSSDDMYRADTMSREPPGLVQQNPLFSQESTVRLTPFGSTVLQEDAEDFGLREIAVRPAVQETELQPQASTSAFAGLPSLPSLPSMPSVASDALSTDEMLGTPHAYMSLGASPMSSASLDPPDPGTDPAGFATRCCFLHAPPVCHNSGCSPSTQAPFITKRLQAACCFMQRWCMCKLGRVHVRWDRSSRFRPTMAAVRKANQRFSMLRSRVMQRTGSGTNASLAGSDDLQRVQRELSASASAHRGLSPCFKCCHSHAVLMHRYCSWPSSHDECQGTVHRRTPGGCCAEGHARWREEKERVWEGFPKRLSF